jgi:preprotein translocase subunit SecG
MTVDVRPKTAGEPVPHGSRTSRQSSANPTKNRFYHPATRPPFGDRREIRSASPLVNATCRRGRGSGVCGLLGFERGAKAKLLADKSALWPPVVSWCTNPVGGPSRPPTQPEKRATGSTSMQTVLLVIHMMIAAALVGVVLVQRSEGGALGIGGGGFMTGRGAANALTRLTTYLGAAFFATSVALALLANHMNADRSVFETPASAPAPAPAVPGSADAPATAPARGGVLDKLQLPGGGQAPAPTGPVVPKGQ